MYVVFLSLIKISHQSTPALVTNLRFNTGKGLICDPQLTGEDSFLLSNLLLDSLAQMTISQSEKKKLVGRK